jgi:hypothetical protein
MTRWYYTLDNRNRLGLLTSEQLRQLAPAGTIRPESMVIPESGGKWVPATKLKGLFPKTAPASPLVATVIVRCPGCGRAISLQEHEQTLNIQCARCATKFAPSQAAAQAAFPRSG